MSKIKVSGILTIILLIAVALHFIPISQKSGVIRIQTKSYSCEDVPEKIYKYRLVTNGLEPYRQKSSELFIPIDHMGVYCEYQSATAKLYAF